MKSDKHNQHLILRVTEYGLNHQRFTLPNLRKDLKLSDDEYDYVYNTLTMVEKSHTDNPNHILVGARLKYVGQLPYAHNETSTYSLVPNAFYNYVDYLEIKEAREQSKEAKSLAIKAIWISVAAIIVTVVVEFFLFFLDKFIYVK